MSTLATERDPVTPVDLAVSPEPEPSKLADLPPADDGDYTLVIRPPRGWAPLDLREVWQFRDLLTTLAGRDLKLRYKQTVLGVIWVVLQPLLAAGIFAIVFGGIAGLDAPGAIPYFVFSYAGLLGWNLFSGTLTKTSGCLVGNSHLISKVYFPRLILPLSQTGSGLVDFGVALGMMGVLLLAFGIVPGWGIVLLPVWTLLVLMLSIGVGLITASLAVSYRDVNYILPVFVQMMLYASPVAYSMEQVVARLGDGDGWKTQALHLFFAINPMSGLLEGFRWSLLGTGHLDPLQLAYSVLAAVTLFVVGAYAFKSMEAKFADVI